MSENPIEDPAEQPLRDAVVALLYRIPETWAEYDLDSLTAIDEKALFHLTAAGLVDRRLRFHIQPHGGTVAVEATITATGEGGLAQAFYPLLDSMRKVWETRISEWRGGQSGETFGVTQLLKPSEWRLTINGVKDRKRQRESEQSPHLMIRRDIVDWVLKCGVYDGGTYSIAGQEIFRLPQAGEGKLVSMRKVSAESGSVARVHIVNWNDAEPAMEAAYKRVLESQGDANSPPAQPASNMSASPDFTSVKWGKESFTFSKGRQADIVQVLWEAWIHGRHCLSEKTIADKIQVEGDNFRMAHVFRKKKKGGGYTPHPAIGTMIQSPEKGVFSLRDP